MTDRFLKAKHWQLFLLTFGIPFLFQVIFMITMITNLSNSNLHPDGMFTYVKLFPIVMVLFMGVFFGWFWAVATGLQRLIPAEVPLNVTRFKIFFIIPVVYILFFLLFMISMVDSGGPDPLVFVLIIPVHLFSMFCIFYCLYFAAKTIKTAELKRKLTFSDFAGEFFMLWFYPIGIWIIQPRINRLVKGTPETNEHGYSN